MAEISQIKVDGTVYDIVDNSSGYTTNTGTITEVKTTGGAHTAIDVTSGVAQFNIPTATSHLTNDSNFITAADVPVDSAPTSGGTNAVSSGGVYTALANKKIWTGTCSTAASTAAKAVTLHDDTGFTIAAGTFMLVHFSNGNTLNSFTLSVNSSAAKSAYIHNGSTITSSSPGLQMYQKEWALFGYDGNQWIMHSTGYGLAKVFATLASPTFTGTPKAPTAASGTNTTQIATTAFVQDAVNQAAGGAVAFQGVINSNTAISGLSSYTAGWYWVVGTAGTYVGQTCEVGDMIFCKNSNTTYSASDFNVLQVNVTGLGDLAYKDTASGTVSGTVGTPTITVTPSTKSIYQITGVGSAATFSVSNGVLTITAGSAPTRASVTVATGISSASSTQPTFSGSVTVS